MKNITNLEHQLLIMKNNLNGIPRSICEAAYCAKHQTEDCRSVKQCQDCEFCNNSKAIAKVLLSEYKEKPKLTDDEKIILRNLPKKFNWIVRFDGFDIPMLSENKPYKRKNTWFSNNGFTTLEPFGHLFKFIKYDDQEPYSIEKLLEEE